MGKVRPAQPQGKAQPKMKAAASKEAQNKQNGSPQQKQAARKNQAHKEEERKAGKITGVPVVPAQDSVSLLNKAYQKLQDLNIPYGGHRIRAMRHIGAALGHLGSSAPLWTDNLKGKGNTPRPASDTRLREARESLDRVRSQFAARSPSAPGNGNARRAVNDAIREIDSALIVR